MTFLVGCLLNVHVHSCLCWGNPFHVVLPCEKVSFMFCKYLLMYLFCKIFSYMRMGNQHCTSMVSRFSSGMSLGVDDSFNSVLVNSGHMFQSSKTGHNVTHCQTMQHWKCLCSLWPSCYFMDWRVSEHFSVPNEIHNSYAGWKVNVTERANTTFMSTVLCMILWRSWQAARDTWSNIWLSASSFDNSQLIRIPNID
jgi:hypothetical protein